METITEHPIHLHRVKHTTRARCIRTEPSFVEIQNQLQSLYFVHNELEKIVLNSVTHFLGGGDRVWVIFICTDRSCDTSFERSLYLHYFVGNSFQSLLSSMCSGYPIWLHPYIEGLSKATHNIRYKKILGIGTFLAILLFCRIVKSRTYTKIRRRIILNTNLCRTVDRIIGL